MIKKFRDVEAGSDILVGGLNAFKMTEKTALVWGGVIRNEKGFYYSWKNGEPITIEVDPDKPVKVIRIDLKALKKKPNLAKRYQAVSVFVASSIDQSRKK
jgi:hypothetical protein